MNYDPHLAKAHFILSRVAMRGRRFTSDDLRALIDTEGIDLKVQALGKALAEAKVAGYIRCVGEQPSRRPENHNRKLDVWELCSNQKPPSGNGELPTHFQENSPAKGASEKFSPSPPDTSKTISLFALDATKK